MDILYTSLSKSVIHDDYDGKKSKLNCNHETSTPLNDDLKTKNTSVFNFNPPPNCQSLIQNQSDDLPSRSTSNYENLVRQRVNRVILNDNQQIDAEIKLKEDYIKHLKSIDLAKYSFPNEYVDFVFKY
jgi:hypothetical protein